MTTTGGAQRGQLESSDGSQRLLSPAFVLLTVSGFFAMSGFASTLPLVPRLVEGELAGGKVAVGLASLPDRSLQPGAAGAGRAAGQAGGRLASFFYPGAVLPAIILFGGLVTFTALNGFMPLYVEERELGSAGLVLMVYGLGVLVVRIGGSRLPDRFGTLRMSVVSLIGQSAGMLVMALWASQTGLIVGALVLAVGGSYLYPTLLTAAIYKVPDNERARATSTFSMAFEMSAGLGGPVLGVAAALAGTQAAFWGAGIAALAVLPVLYWWATARPETLIPPRV